MSSGSPTDRHPRAAGAAPDRHPPAGDPDGAGPRGRGPADRRRRTDDGDSSEIRATEGDSVDPADPDANHPAAPEPAPLMPLVVARSAESALPIASGRAPGTSGVEETGWSQAPTIGARDSAVTAAGGSSPAREAAATAPGSAPARSMGPLTVPVQRSASPRHRVPDRPVRRDGSAMSARRPRSVRSRRPPPRQPRPRRGDGGRTRRDDHARGHRRHAESATCGAHRRAGGGTVGDGVAGSAARPADCGRARAGGRRARTGHIRASRVGRRGDRAAGQRTSPGGAIPEGRGRLPARGSGDR